MIPHKIRENVLSMKKLMERLKKDDARKRQDPTSLQNIIHFLPLSV